MFEIRYINRLSKKEETEKIYGKVFIQTLYGKHPLSKVTSLFLLPLVSRLPFLSKLYGFFQKTRWSKHKIKPFIEAFGVDPSEFLEPVESFQSFNDFFIRRLNPSSRPIIHGNDVATLPADGRYLVYPHIDRVDGFVIKGRKFCLETLLKDAKLAHHYSQGAMVLARLCPLDYHRFHFPCNCIPIAAKAIDGPLFSVNPLALKKNIHILSENKRVMTSLHTKNFGTVLYIEVGATYVGSIHQTFIPQEPYAKGDEKGYFSFGGSCLILLFEPGRIEFDRDLLDASSRHMETRGLFGQSMGRALSPI